MLILNRNIFGLLVLAVVVISAQESERRTNVIEIGEERDSDDDVYYEADVTLQARDKRTIGAILSGVADLFGYDVQRRPSVLAVQAVPIAAAQVQAAPAAAPDAAAPAAPANAAAGTGPELARQMAPAAPPPAAPAPAPAAPVTPPATLTAGVRRAFQVGVNWSNQRQQLGPPAPAAPAPAPAPAAPVPPPAPAAPPVQGEMRSYTVGLNWQNLRQQLGAPAPAAGAAPAPAPAGPPPPQGFRQSYQLGFDFANQRQQLGGPPPGAAPPPAAAAAAPRAPAPAPAAAPPAGAPIANLGRGPPRVPQLLKQKPILTPTLVERIYFDKSNAPTIKKVYYPKKTEFENRPPLNAKPDRDIDREVPRKALPLEGEEIDRRPPVRLDTPPRDIDEPPPRQEEEEREDNNSEEEEDGSERESNDDREEIKERPREIELYERIGKKEPPRGFRLEERKEPPRGFRGRAPNSGWRKEETGDPNEEAYVLEEDYTYGDKANKFQPPKNSKKFRQFPTGGPESVNVPSLTLLQLLSDDMPEEIRQFNREFNHHRSEEGQKQEPAAEKEKAQVVTQATPVQNVENIGSPPRLHGSVHSQHQAILRDLVDNFEHQQRVLSNKQPSAPGVDKRKEVEAYYSKALDGIVKTFEKKARQELLGDKHLVNQHKQILEALKERIKEKQPAQQEEHDREHKENNSEEPMKEEVEREKENDKEEENVEKQPKQENENPQGNEERDDLRVKVGNEDVVGPNEEYINAEEPKQEKEELKEDKDDEEEEELKEEKGDEEKEELKEEKDDEEKQEVKQENDEEGKQELKQEKNAESPQNKKEDEKKDVLDLPYFFNPADFVKEIEKIVYADGGAVERRNKNDDDGSVTVEIEEKFERVNGQPIVKNADNKQKANDDNGFGNIRQEIDRNFEQVNNKDDTEEDDESKEVDDDKEQIEETPEKAEERDDNDDEKPPARPEEDEESDEKPTSRPENEEEEEEESEETDEKKPTNVENDEKESDETPTLRPQNEEEEEESKKTDEKKPTNVENDDKESDETPTLRPQNEDEEEESEESEEDEKPTNVEESDEKATSRPENEGEEEEESEEDEKPTNVQEKQGQSNTEDDEETDERTQQSNAKEDAAETEEEAEEEEDDEESGDEETAKPASEEEVAKLREEEEKRRKLDENEKALKEYINEHFEVDVINGIPIPKGLKDSDRYKEIVERVKAPVDESFSTISPKNFEFKLNNLFGQNFENNLKKLEKADNKVEEEEEEVDEDEAEEGETNGNEDKVEEEGDEEVEAENDEAEEEEQTEPKPQIQEDQSKQSKILQYPHEQKPQELYAQFRQKFENPETQDSNKYEVVQANLHSGGFQPAGVESLDNPGQLFNVPIEYDYSSSEKKLVVEPRDKLSRAKRDTVGEIVWSYQPESYNPNFEDDVIPEPKAEDLSHLEAKNYKEDDSLSPKAFVTENESGRKRTYIRVNQKQEAMFG